MTCCVPMRTLLPCCNSPHYSTPYPNNAQLNSFTTNYSQKKLQCHNHYFLRLGLQGPTTQKLPTLLRYFCTLFVATMSHLSTNQCWIRQTSNSLNLHMFASHTHKPTIHKCRTNKTKNDYR